MKVVHSRIDEGSNGKPEKVSKATITTQDKKGREKKVDFEFDGDDKDDDSESKYKKTYIQFGDSGKVIGAYDISTIDKDIKFFEKPEAHWEFGIIINRGLVPTAFHPNVDVDIWYLTEEYRDKRYKELIEEMEDAGFSFIKV